MPQLLIEFIISKFDNMGAIKVKFHNEQEEKVLISILDSLNYDYEPQYTTEDESSIAEALERSEKNFQDGLFSTHQEVMERAKNKYGL